jgi:hypothetical protein
MDNANAHAHAGAYGLPVGGIPPWFRFSLDIAQVPTPIARVLTGGEILSPAIVDRRGGDSPRPITIVESWAT